jgi:predicted O-methyltransferase YrrM
MSSTTTKDEPHWGVDPNAYVTENNPRWTAVDQYSLPHLHNSSNPHHAAIEHALQTSLDQGLEDISVAPSQGKFLAVQCQLVGAKRILEIGTLGAYSTIWMGSSSPDVQIVSIEIDERTAAIARENIKFAGMEDRIEVVVGSALEVLPRIAKDVEEGKMDRFDFSFIDADKAEALDYFEWAVKLSNKKACIYLDNMVRKGLLADEELAQTDRNVKGIRRAVEGIGKMDSVEAVIIQTVSEKNYDGFLMAVVK